MKKLFFALTLLFALSFLMNFFWESLHGFSLYTEHVIDSDKYVWMMIYMSLMDALTILGMYLFFALFVKDIFWLKEINFKRLIIFFILGLIVGTFAEYRAVYVSHDWHYNERMPVIFGIGLSPFLQLSVTSLMSLFMTRKLID